MRGFGGIGAAVLCALLAGCGAVGSTPAAEPEPTGGAGIPVQAPTDVPSIPTDDASPGVELSLPQLPVGGATSPERGSEVQCGEIDWNAFDGDASLSAGVTVVVTGYRLDRGFFQPLSGRCDEPVPNCLDFTFGPGQARCAVAVQPVEPRPNRAPVLELEVVGRADCSGVDRATCERFVRAVREAGGGTVSLQAPAEPTPSPTPSPTA